MKITCSICRAKHGSQEDRELGSPWLGCAYDGCDYWVHSFCVGIDGEGSKLRNIGNFWCSQHNPKRARFAKEENYCV